DQQGREDQLTALAGVHGATSARSSSRSRWLQAAMTGGDGSVGEVGCLLFHLIWRQTPPGFFIAPESRHVCPYHRHAAKAAALAAFALFGCRGPSAGSPPHPA